jgi:uncharacterized repeat protein (TIGR01451 family)
MVTYDITTSNAGPSDAQGVSLTDTMPADVNFVSRTVPAGWTCPTLPAVGTSGTIVCNPTGATMTFPANNDGTVNTVVFTLVGQVPSSASGGLESNTATVMTTTTNTSTMTTSTVDFAAVTSADLGVAKTDDVGGTFSAATNNTTGGTATAGNVVTFTLSVTNAGPSDAQNVLLTDTLPAAMTLGTVTEVSSSNGHGGPGTAVFTCTPSGNTVNCTAPTMPAGENAIFQVVGTVNSNTPNFASVTNQANVGSGTGDQNTTNNVSTDTFTVRTAADLAITKSTTPPGATATAGMPFTYTLTVTNNGPSDAQDVDVTDTLPPGTDFVSATPAVGNPDTFNCNGSGTSLMCHANTVGAHNTDTITVVVNVLSSTTGASLSNTASVTTPTFDTNAGNDTSTISNPLSVQANISVTKNGPTTPVTAGTPITYTITVTNAGPADAVNVQVTDTIPANEKFQSEILGTGLQPNCTFPANGGTTLTCTYTTPVVAGSPASTFELVVLVNANVTAGTTITNTAMLATSTPNNPAAVTSSSTTTGAVAASADVSITKNGPGTVTAGMDATYSISVTNTGPSDALAVMTTDSPPAGTTVVSFTQDSGPPDGSTLPAGMAETFTIVLHVNADVANGTMLTNTANVTTTTANTSTMTMANFTSTVMALADVSITKTGPSIMTAGVPATYTISLTNTGPSDAQGVSVTDTVPSGTTFGSATGVPPFTCGFANGTVTCTDTTLAAGASATATLVVTPNANLAAGSTVSNTASVATSTGNSSTNTSSTFTASIVTQSGVGVTKTGPATVTAGDTATYTISVSNTGPSDAQNVNLTDAVPAGTTFLSESPVSGPTFGCQTPGPGGTGSMVCTLGTLPVGKTAVLAEVLTFDASDLAGSMVTNMANVSTGTKNVVVPPASTTSSVTTTVAAAVTLTMTKSGPGSVTAGNDITYTLSATNGGPSDAQGITVTYMVPTGTTFVSLTSPTGFTCNNLPGVGGTGTIMCTEPTLAAGDSAVFALVVKATSSDANNSTITNTASVASTTPGATPGSNMSSFTVNTTVTAAADVSIVKTAPQNVTAGTNMTYSITVTNAGPSDATGVTVNDTLPTSTTFVSETQSPAAPAFACNAPAPGATLTCGPATLTSGSSMVLSVVVHVLASAANGSNIGNTAMVTTTSTNTSTMTSSTANTAVTDVADVAVTKTGPANVTAGSNATYTVTVTNNGPSDAQSVTVSESVPANATLVSMTQVPPGGPPAFTQTGPSTFTITTLAGPTTVGGTGASATFQVVLHVDSSAANGSTVSDTASVSSTTTDNNTLNNSFTLNTPVVASATLTLTKTGPATITAGTNATYTVSLTNTGPSDAQTVSVTDLPLPANTTFVSETQVATPGATPFLCSLVGTTPTCSAPTLPAAGTATFTLVLKLAASAPPSPPPITNTANVTTTTTLGAGSVTTATFNSNVVTFAALGVTKTGPNTITAGTDATFTISVTNAGPSDAQTVTLSDTLPIAPTPMTFVSETPLAGFACIPPPVPGPGGTITCTAPTMPAGASATFTIVAHLASTTANNTAGSNTATLSSATTPPTNTMPATSTAPFTAVAVADLSVRKLAAPTSVLEGDSVTYTMTVSNAGPSDAASVTLTDGFGAGSGFVSSNQSQGTASLFGSTLTYSLGTIPAGGTATAQLVLTYPEDGSPVNAATVSSPTMDPTVLDNTSSVTVSVVEPPTSATGTALSVQEGVPLNNAVLATFPHGNGGEPASNFSAVIAWGDGASSLGTIASIPGGYEVLGSHTYADEPSIAVDDRGPFPITVRIADDASFEAVAVTTANVQETPLPAAVPSAPHGSQNERFVSELWTDLFGTPAPASQIQNLAGLLNGGAVSRRTVARLLIRRAGGVLGVNAHLGLPSNASARGIVKNYWLHFLDRPVQGANLQGHANVVAAGGSLNLLLNLLSSQEYFDKVRF